MPAVPVISPILPATRPHEGPGTAARSFFSGHERADRSLACNVQRRFVGSDGAITLRGPPITSTRAVRARPGPGVGQGGAPIR